jgi:protease-4
MRFLPKRQKVAVVEIFGTIGGSVKSPAYERIFSTVLKDRKLRALVLDIDSPGGSVPASEYLYHAVARIAEDKPVVACIRGLGASGGYFISCAAHRIVASPGAIVGSVGVISVRPVLETLLQRLGVSVNVNKSGEFKDMGAIWRGATPEETQKMQTLVDESFDRFVSVVAESRQMSEDAVRDLATGEVFWAPRAREVGLVDELGDLDRAIDLAAEMSGARRAPVFIRPRRGFRERLFGPLAASLVESAIDEAERRLWMNSLRY